MNIVENGISLNPNSFIQTSTAHNVFKSFHLKTFTHTHTCIHTHTDTHIYSNTHIYSKNKT